MSASSGPRPCAVMWQSAGAVKVGEIAKRLRHLVVAGAQRPRHLAVEDQKSAIARACILLVDPAVAAVRRDRAQDGRPLDAVLAADHLVLRQQA